MKATTKALANRFASLVIHNIKSGENLQSCAKEVAPIYNKLPVEEQHAFRNHIATAIGRHYNVTPKVMAQGINKGRLGFLAADVAGGTKRSDAARVKLNEYLPLKRVAKEGSEETTSHARTLTDYEKDVLSVARHMAAGKYTKAKLNRFAEDVLAAVATLKAAKK